MLFPFLSINRINNHIENQQLTENTKPDNIKVPARTGCTPSLGIDFRKQHKTKRQYITHWKRDSYI